MELEWIWRCIIAILLYGFRGYRPNGFTTTDIADSAFSKSCSTFINGYYRFLVTCQFIANQRTLQVQPWFASGICPSASRLKTSLSPRRRLPRPLGSSFTMPEFSPFCRSNFPLYISNSASSADLQTGSPKTRDLLQASATLESLIPQIGGPTSKHNLKQSGMLATRE